MHVLSQCFLNAPAVKRRLCFARKISELWASFEKCSPKRPRVERCSYKQASVPSRPPPPPLPLISCPFWLYFPLLNSNYYSFIEQLVSSRLCLLLSLCMLYSADVNDASLECVLKLVCEKLSEQIAVKKRAQVSRALKVHEILQLEHVPSRGQLKIYSEGQGKGFGSWTYMFEVKIFDEKCKDLLLLENFAFWNFKWEDFLCFSLTFLVILYICISVKLLGSSLSYANDFVFHLFPYPENSLPFQMHSKNSIKCKRFCFEKGRLIQPGVKNRIVSKCAR